MGRRDCGDCNTLRRQGLADPRREVIRIGRVIDMLELTPAAGGEMAARRRDAMRAGGDCPICVQNVTGRGHWRKAAISGNTIPARGEADDLVWIDHKQATMAAGMCFGKSSAISPGPARLAALL